jgi:hypothetical protein
MFLSHQALVKLTAPFRFDDFDFAHPTRFPHAWQTRFRPHFRAEVRGQASTRNAPQRIPIVSGTELSDSTGITLI